MDARAWLAEVIRLMKHEEFTRVVVPLWAIWYARLKAIHENHFQSPLPSSALLTNWRRLGRGIINHDQKKSRESNLHTGSVFRRGWPRSTWMR